MNLGDGTIKIDNSRYVGLGKMRACAVSAFPGLFQILLISPPLVQSHLYADRAHVLKPSDRKKVTVKWQGLFCLSSMLHEQYRFKHAITKSIALGKTVIKTTTLYEQGAEDCEF